MRADESADPMLRGKFEKTLKAIMVRLKLAFSNGRYAENVPVPDA